MATLPRISVVTVTFNAEAELEKTLRSVAAQTYGDLEFLLIDGGSRDNTLQVAERYRDRIDYLVSEPDRGLYDAMNKGVAAATGDYVILLNADDEFIDENVVADVARFLADHPDVDVLYGNTEQVREYGTRIDVPTTHYRNRKMTISPQATFTRTSLMRAHPLNLAYRYAADFEQSTAFVREGRVFRHIDRVISRVELRTGVTHDNHLASEAEIYEILESQGFDVRREKRRKLRNIRLVAAFKKHAPRWIAHPVLRLIAKYYKPM